jgi:hypothetical protein
VNARIRTGLRVEEVPVFHFDLYDFTYPREYADPWYKGWVCPGGGLNDVEKGILTPSGLEL